MVIQKENPLSKRPGETSTRIPKPRSQMRKRPQQERSRALVQAIVEAGARILGTQGWARFTTNAVAEAAGVSVGSLYQYFPNKQALVEAIRDRHLQDCLSAVRARRGLFAEQPLRDVVQSLVDGMVAAHAEHPGLHRVLLEELPIEEAGRDPHSTFEKNYLANFEEIAEACGAGPTARIVGTIVSDLVDGVIHNAVRRGTLQDPSVCEELVDALVLYLTAAGRRPLEIQFPSGRSFSTNESSPER